MFLRKILFKNRISINYGRKLCQYNNFSNNVRDITNNIVTGQISDDNLALLNDSILNLLQDDAIPLISNEQSVLSSDSCPFFIIVYLLSKIKYQNQSSNEIAACLRHLNQLSYDNKLNKRETFYAASLLALTEQKYSLAADYMESVILSCDRDELALRFAQEYHTLAGIGYSFNFYLFHFI